MFAFVFLFKWNSNKEKPKQWHNHSDSSLYTIYLCIDAEEKEKEGLQGFSKPKFSHIKETLMQFSTASKVFVLLFSTGVFTFEERVRKSFKTTPTKMGSLSQWKFHYTSGLSLLFYLAFNFSFCFSFEWNSSSFTSYREKTTIHFKIWVGIRNKFCTK